MKPLLAMNIALGPLLFGLLPVSSPAAHAGGISINAPGVSINIGSRDRRGYYWDGYEWRSPDWWKHRKGYYGHRNRHGYYWDGGRWRDRGWWNKHHHHRPPPPTGLFIIRAICWHSVSSRASQQVEQGML